MEKMKNEEKNNESKSVLFLHKMNENSSEWANISG